MPSPSNVNFRFATAADAPEVARMVLALTAEISAALPPLPEGGHFAIELEASTVLCRRFLTQGHYHAVLACSGGRVVAVATLAESHALYAGGKIGVLQEFYVEPQQRGSGIGAALLEQALALARSRHCVRVEVCTPPLPQFENALAFYQARGFEAVGGRKMRRLW